MSQFPSLYSSAENMVGIHFAFSKKRRDMPVIQLPAQAFLNPALARSAPPPLIPEGFAMIADDVRRVDDLTPREAALVVRAYETSLILDEHDDAFALAMGVFRSFRPDLPLAVIAAELDLLLACAPRA